MTQKDAIKLADKFGGRVYEGYSGRGMFGAVTFGVVLDRYSFEDYKNSRCKKRNEDCLELDVIIY